MKRFLIVLLFLPTLANAAVYQFPSGKVFEERTIFYRALSGVTVPVTEWIEVSANLKYIATGWLPVAKASAPDLTLREEIALWLRSYSETYDIPQLYDLAVCESNLNQKALGDKGKSLGIFQWQAHSWAYYSKKYKMDIERENWKDQLELTVKVLQEKDGWRNWYNCWQYLQFKTWDKKLWK